MVSGVLRAVACERWTILTRALMGEAPGLAVEVGGF